ncbi:MULTISPECIES: BadF/BadG/BcrA/BcrD ATPase family protein [Micrococcaceae]|uniref:BadF/BadG/BcrA/BcrD ATPase family protein n=1 Tax=Paenarthrobacter aurescens (strain TC1) TaxID=290340 RepID=A1R8H1_PAEAT|nr:MULTISPECIES: BadF/BadG/BcrA/BcrD ATPase family protein [Micrococcaceae]ABM07625.1 putative BadF/BadG/BcrA/BcrD ATPase family protein [Paenarthrobacter aurescens TC1]AFR29863.1 N-acetyl-D-glucosamine kinase Nagk [Arthrobacter sp. Rue61a]MBP2265067.1 N-acetylglucosamine kinase-like BadF-type ATPase [Pseudarthrobacter sp. PvP004]
MNNLDSVQHSQASAEAVSGTVIGLDIGGTKTRGVRFENGTPVRDENAGSSNVQNVSREQAAANLAELFGKIGGGQIDQVYAGSGGIDTDEDAQALADLIAPHAPGARITVVHDSRLLLAAGGANTGVAVIAGTGSAAWGKNDAGEEARAGGWGYLLGDEGSGYWLGREAVRHSLRRMNQGKEPDRLSRALLDSVGVDEPGKLIALFHSPDTGRRYWAQQARLVVEAADAGDETCRALVDQAGRDLADLAEQAVRQLGLDGPVILGSGLGMNVPRLQEAFKAKLAESGITDVRILQQDPVFGVPRLVAEQRL